jgi:two-component system, OmpR family, manganese sensing sensor histidine kinase
MIRHLGWRLLLAYLTVMAAIFGLSAAAVYFFFVHSLYQQLDSRLLTLAQAAAPSLTAVKTEGDRHLDKRDEIPWQELFRRNQQSLSWFDANGRELARRGFNQVHLPLKTGILTLEEQHIRTFTIPVYSRPQAQPQPILEGYIRASESTTEIEEVISRLRWGFGLGGVVALTLSGIGGVWLVQKSLEPTRQSLQQLKQFTADASHELRSPLTAVKTSIEVILKHPERIHPKDARKLSAIASATQQMARLVEDLLFLARADSTIPAQPLKKTPTRLDTILQDLLTLLEPQAQTRKIRLRSKLISGLVIMGDGDKLHRLFANLLENALQYTPEGGMVSLSLARIDKAAIVNIEDTGIGIPPMQLPFVFERLWRADRARTYRSGGLGLGLAIAQAIAHQHNGEITVNSRVGIGSSFRVKLPLITNPSPLHPKL